MTPDGKTEIYGIIGHPVAHSLSPLMQNFYAEEAGLNLSYLPFPVEPGQVGEAVRGAFALGIQGLNVTVPHKQEVMECLAGVSQAAAAIGAVNTLVRVENGFQGYNTDAEGLALALKESGAEITGRTCFLIGAGGAARAAAWVLGAGGAKRVYILNRSAEKAAALAASFAPRFARAGADSSGLFVPLPLAGWRDVQEDGCLAVQATSVGMAPRADTAPIEDEAFYRKLAFAYDAVYTPMDTKFLRLARSAGAQTGSGLSMLLYQGIAAFKLWHPETSLSDETVRAAYKKLLEQLKGKTG